jgi:hypothetical protein
LPLFTKLPTRGLLGNSDTTVTVGRHSKLYEVRPDTRRKAARCECAGFRLVLLIGALPWLNDAAYAVLCYAFLTVGMECTAPIP